MAELRAALSAAPGTRSSLHQWMRANYDEVSTLLVLPRFAWKALKWGWSSFGRSNIQGYMHELLPISDCRIDKVREAGPADLCVTV